MTRTHLSKSNLKVSHVNLPETGRTLRSWQRQALETYVEKGEPEDFLVTATPGAGKTTFALTFARWLKERRLVNRIIVVVPTDHLRSQWSEAANELGVILDPTLSNDVGPVASDFDGYVATYAQVAMKPMLHRARTERQTTLVILDEVHHAGDGLTWGEGVRMAFSPATKRLSLTGTPFRTSATETIPFVRYEEESDGSQRSTADYSYGYGHALADHVVRPVMFAAYSGVARWKNSAGDVISASLSEPGTKDTEMTAWRTALNPGGQWIPHVVAAADARLSEIREAGMSDAGAMMLASDQEHARAYAAVIEKVTGHKPVTILSEDPKASLKIDAFSRSDDRWLVAVRMVSEGVDVPRLAVGVWATSYRTPLFFAQAVGRFVRSRRRGETATVFLPAVRPLLALAAQMEEEREHVIAAPAAVDDLMDPFQPELPEPASDAMGFEALDAEAEFAHVLFGGQALLGDGPALELSADDEEFLGLPGLLDPSQMATLLKQRETEHRKTVASRGVPEQSPAQVQQAHKQAAALRKEINSLVSRNALRSGRPHAQIHSQVRASVPGPPSASASLAVLEKRRDFLLAL
jgi:superfamily II DNA or RNA helicase